MSESARFNGSPSEVQTGGGDAVNRVLEICNKRGLHARASAKFVQTVEKFYADVRVRRGQEVVGGTSIMGLMMLAANEGCEIVIEAKGPDADVALAAMVALVEAKFGED